jgi:hypothetical protein
MLTNTLYNFRDVSANLQKSRTILTDVYNFEDQFVYQWTYDFRCIYMSCLEKVYLE